MPHRASNPQLLTEKLTCTPWFVGMEGMPLCGVGEKNPQIDEKDLQFSLLCWKTPVLHLLCVCPYFYTMEHLAFWPFWLPDGGEESPPSSTVTPAGWPTNLTQFCYYLPGDGASDPTDSGLSPKRLCPPHIRCQSQVIGPQITKNFCPTWLQIRGSHCPLLKFHNLL